MKVKSEREVDQLCLTLRDPMDHSLPGSSIHGIFQARVLEWGAIAFSDQDYGWPQKKVLLVFSLNKNPVNLDSNLWHLFFFPHHRIYHVSFTYQMPLV